MQLDVFCAAILPRVFGQKYPRQQAADVLTLRGQYRMPQTHRAHVSVWLASIQTLAVAESLGLRLELYVCFDTYHCLIASRLRSCQHIAVRNMTRGCCPNSTREQLTCWLGCFVEGSATAADAQRVECDDRPQIDPCVNLRKGSDGRRAVRTPHSALL